MQKLVTAAVGLAAASALMLGLPATGGGSPVVGASDAAYAACGRVFPDPHAFWPSPAQTAARSPFAKGNAACASVDFLSYGDMVSGLEYMESLFPQFIEFYELERDFGDGSDCTSSTSSADLCSAGLPRQGFPAGRVKSDLYLLRVTDERVADDAKKFFTFPLSIHGIERAGAEAGVRAAEDLATWGYCEAVAGATLAPNGRTQCAQEGALPHPLLETTPGQSVTAGDALQRSAIYFVFANPDGWRRGDPDNLVRFFQRYNGNGVDMNRDWPTIGFTFRPYTPWSEPETRAFGRVMKQIRPKWDGGIDLHGQLIDRAFSFTLLGASERNYDKNQRILQTVKGAWADAEARLSWSPAIKPNTAPADDQRMYGVQWGTVWDTIDYTVTGALGDWIDSPLGLDADGIDNEMSFSHVSNCGVGSCYLPDFEQLHVDGNKSLVYSMVNFSLLPEETTFAAPGKVGYVFDPKVLRNDGTVETPPPGAGLPPQAAIMDVSLDPTNDFTHEFVVRGVEDGVFNGGLEGKATVTNVAGISPATANSISALVLEQYRPEEETPQEDAGCGEVGDDWGEVNRYFNQSELYLQAGQAVHSNLPLPGRWRICLTGGLASKAALNGGTVDLDITFSGEKAWEDPGQKPYEATNMKFFTDLARNMAPGQLVPVSVDDVLAGTVDLDGFTSLVVADSALPGYGESPRTGPAQGPQSFDALVATAATAPCAWPTNPVLPPTCVADFEFDVDSAFNNQQMTVALTAENAVDYDLYIERQGRVTGEWMPVGQSASGSASETATIISPIAGHYRARVVNWAAGLPADRVDVSFSNVYAGPPIEPSTRTDAQRDAWGAKLRAFVENGGNLVLTDGGLRNLAYMGAVERRFVNTFSVYAGYIGFTRDGQAATYDDPLARDVNQPGAAEGPQHRHQTYEPVPIGYAITAADDDTDFNSSPVWAVDQGEWERLGGRTVGTTTPDQVTLGELGLGSGVVRVIGALLPMPTERYYHPFGLANYALTYTGYQVLLNSLQWQRPLPDLAVTAGDIAFSTQKSATTITATVRNLGAAAARDVAVRFADNGAQIGSVQTIASIAAGGSGTASVLWNTKGIKGERTISVTADAANAIVESNEANNVGVRAVVVKGNQVQNGSFEQSSSGSAPDSWSSSGATGYGSGGSEGARSVSTGAGGSWTSAPVPVTAGRSYGVAVDVSGAGGTLAVEQLSATGALLATVTQPLGIVPAATFQTVLASVTPAAGVTAVRIRLTGSVLGTTRFDDVWLSEEL